MGKSKSKKPVSKKSQWDWLFWLITIAIIAIVVIAIRDGNSVPLNPAQNTPAVQQPASSVQAPSNSNSETPGVKVETQGGDNSKFKVETIPPNTQNSNGAQGAAPKQ